MQNQEISEIIQIIELTGRGLGFLLKAGTDITKLAGQATVQTIKEAQIMNMRTKLMLHYSSKGKYSSFDIKDLERLTGGAYSLLKIPLENGKNENKEIIAFFDALKTLKIPFTELPDINIGDGYMEIAYDPADAEKLQALLEDYNFPENEKAEEIDLGQYYKNGTTDGIEMLEHEAIIKAKAEESQTLSAEKKNKDMQTLSNLIAPKNMQLITIDHNLVLKETNEGYITRVPHTKGHEYIFLPKNKVTWINNGKTIKTFLDLNASQKVFSKDGEFRYEKSNQVLANCYDDREDLLHRDDAKGDRSRSGNTMRKTKVIPRRG